MSKTDGSMYENHRLGRDATMQADRRAQYTETGVNQITATFLEMFPRLHATGRTFTDYEEDQIAHCYRDVGGPLCPEMRSRPR
jgi:hypothetical protein